MNFYHLKIQQNKLKIVLMMSIQKCISSNKIYKEEWKVICFNDEHSLRTESPNEVTENGFAICYNN